MKKLLIKIIKRQDVEAAAAARILDLLTAAPPPSTPEGAERTARRRRHDRAVVVGTWIPERDLNRQAEVADAVRRLFGNDEPAIKKI